MPAMKQAANTGAERAFPLESNPEVLARKSRLIRAICLWRQGAARGDVEDQYNLGLAYMKGNGVAQDCAEGARWLRRAAERGHIGGRINLGVAYALGKGVPQDAVLAHMWFNLAAAEGNERARENRIKIVRKMTPEQVADAQRLAREWKPVALC